MLRSMFYCAKIVVDKTMKRKVSHYIKENWYDILIPYYFVVVCTDPSGKNIMTDINNAFIDIFDHIKESLKLSANKVHNRFTINIDAILIDDNEAKIVRYAFHKRSVKMSIMQVVPISSIPDKYIYIGYNNDICKIYTTYDEVYSDMCHANIRCNDTLYVMLKVSTKHISSDYAFCSDNNQKDNEYYYDIEETLDRNDPIGYYDYCMQLIAGELTYYRKDLSTYSYWLELCCAKSYADFLNPKYVEDMMSLKYPIEWDKDYYEEE